jgi:hypothetical protein
MALENNQNRRHKKINFTGLQNNRNPSQHTVGNLDKASWRLRTSFCFPA